MFGKMIYFFKKTKDKRLKFNIIMGSFVLILFANQVIVYAGLKVLSSLFDINILQYHMHYLILAVNFILSVHFSRLVYYFHYQNDLLVESFNGAKVLETFDDLSERNKINYVSYLIGKHYPFFAFAVLFINLINTKFNILWLTVVSIVIVGIIISKGIINLLVDSNFKTFNNFVDSGILTTYSVDNTKEIKEQGNKDVA